MQYTAVQESVGYELPELELKWFELKIFGPWPEDA
jgi:hypothetical protein